MSQPIAKGFLSTLVAYCKHMVYKLHRSWYSWHIRTIASNAIEYDFRARLGTRVSRDRAISLADVSANKHLRSVQLYANMAHF